MKLNQLFENEHDENRDINKAPAPDGEWITTAQAAKIMGVTMSRVRQMIMDKQLQSKAPEKGRRDNLLNKKDVTDMASKERKPTGRPEGT